MEYPYVDWLTKRYPLINEAAFRSVMVGRILERDKVGQPSEELLQTLHLLKPEENGCEDLIEQLRLQFGQLLETSHQLDEDGFMARRFLIYFLEHKGRPVYDSERKSFNVAAARQLSSLAEEKEFALELKDDLLVLLGYTTGLDAEVKLVLTKSASKLAGLEVKPGVVKDALAEIAFRGLENEINLPAENRNREVINELLLLAQEHPHENLAPFLKALSQHFPDASVRELANTILEIISGSLVAWWRQSIVDLVSSQEARTERLEEVAKPVLDSEETAKTIFIQLKGFRWDSNEEHGRKVIKRLATDERGLVGIAMAFAWFKAKEGSGDVSWGALDDLLVGLLAGESVNQQSGTIQRECAAMHKFATSILAARR
jgi:hypothetical protein